MMRVPRSARPSTMSVKVPREGGYGGEFEQPVEVRRVRFEPVSAWLVREYALGDGAQGLVIADGADSPGMFLMRRSCGNWPIPSGSTAWFRP